MIYGVIPLAIAAIGVAYAGLVIRGSRGRPNPRDNVVFGVLALVDAAMSAWRGVNVLAGESIVSHGVIVPCTIGTALLALVTFEFLWAFPRRRAMPWPVRAAVIAWAGVGIYLAARVSDGAWMSDPSAEIVFFGPATIFTFVLGAIALRATRERSARIVIAMVLLRWAVGFLAYFVGPILGIFEELVWFETTVATTVGFVVIGTAVLRSELFSMRSTAAEVVTIAVMGLSCALGGGAAILATLRWVPVELQTAALCGATFVPLALAWLGYQMYPRLQTALDDRRALRLVVLEEPLPSDRDAAIAEALARIAKMSAGGRARWELPGAASGALAALVVPARGADGTELGAILVDGGTIDRETLLVAQDLAARIALIVERATAVTALEDARRLAALGHFAAAIAHDIRTPLTSISLNVQILRRKLELSPDDAEHLDIALEELGRLDRSVAEILEFAKPVKLVSETIDVGELLDTTARQLTPVLSEKRVALRFESGRELPAVRGDRQRLRQVLVNLVDNAADASTPGAEVTVRAHPRDATVAIEIEDRGRGIAPGDLERIFEPFFTTRADGTGLGLSIVHKVVRAHGGELEVRSAPGAGSTFTVLLPVASSVSS